MEELVEIKIYMPGEELPENLVKPIQKHTKNIKEVFDGKEDLDNCDALITKISNLEIGVSTADCAPICIFSENKIAVVHAGWRGLCLGIVEESLKCFSKDNIKVYIGPHIHNFEIQKDSCYEMIKNKFGDKFFSYIEDKLIFNFTEALLSILPKDVKVDDRDTYLDNSFPSFRRNKTQDRFTTSMKIIKELK